ncbi:MAG: hypothetical protein WBD67_03965 [Terracidiphilus sp.]
MNNNGVTPIPVAVRVYPDPPNEARSKRRNEKWDRPESMLIFDTETTVDATQRLLFGCYRFVDRGVCREEGFFYADDLSKDELNILRQYVAKHKSDAVGRTGLTLISLREFLKKFYAAIYKGRALLVGFNLPFDLSRLGFSVTTARKEFAGGFSLGMWTYEDGNGGACLDPNRPSITIKHIDSKRSLMSLTGRKSADELDQIPEGSKDGKPIKGYRFRGHLLDLKTLAFALTDRGHSLKSACEAFGVERGKLEVSKHGEMTEEYIYYNRRDVEATARLAEKLIQEFDRHPIGLAETKAFSPASIGRAYLREMGIGPILDRQGNLQPYIGYAQTAYFGGRTSAHIRKVPVPVVYVDFLSMYPTVNSLMNLWQFVIAQKINVIDHCQEEIVDFLKTIDDDFLFQPSNWPKLTAFARLIPDGDILPTRGKYSQVSNDWQVALNYLYGTSLDDALWFSLPDVVASVLLTGRIPKIVDAFRIEPSERILKDLKPIRLQGEIEIDPRTQDFFKRVIEERKKIDLRSDLSHEKRTRMSKSMKVLANSTSYGILAQMDYHESNKEVNVTCHGLDATPYMCRVAKYETPGEFCFPPVASLITGGARLMLALLEHCVTRLSGTYAMEDTDSMAIVATERAGLVPCPGGPSRMRNGRKAIRAITRNQVRDIVQRFEALNPYDRKVVPGSILKIEDDNFDPATKKQRQLWCVAVSAKRYALFLKGKSKLPTLLRKGPNGNSKDNHWSEHGLGHLLNPTDPKNEDRAWIAQFWYSIIGDCLGVDTKRIDFAHLPAIGRVTITSPAILIPLAELNKGKKYRDQIKPFNFLLTCHISPLGHPLGADPARFHLIAPFELNSTTWLRLKWIDQYSGRKYKITTEKNFSSRTTARVQTYGDVLLEYAHHSESKCADEHGRPCDRQTIGLLFRRHVQIGEIVPIGKESNKLEEVDAGLIHSAESVYVTYPDPTRDSWTRDVVPKLQAIPLSVLMRETGLSRRMLIKARRGHARPHLRNQRLVEAAMSRLSRKIKN